MTAPIPSWLIIDAVRYAIGRQSYQVGITCAWLRANWSQLDEHARTIVQQDVEEAFRDDDRDRESVRPYKALGMDMDRREWERVRALWAPAGANCKAPLNSSPLDPAGV